MIVGSYSLHLYCDNPSCPGDRYAHPTDPNFLNTPEEFGAETGAECRRRARKRGWKLDLKKGIAICPICTGKRDGVRKV